MSAATESIYRNIDLGVTGQVVSAIPMYIRSLYIYNTGTAVVYLKIYNKATAATASDTPVMTIPIPASSGANLGDIVWRFTNGISVRATTGVADNDTTAPSANQVIVHIGIG